MIINEKQFTDILMMNQGKLKEYLEEALKNARYNDIINGDGFLYAKGIEPYLLVAHLDRHPDLCEKVITIKKYDKDEYGRIKWSSPEGIAGDDRCGVYIILELIKKYHPSILFCEDEEGGCVGSDKFINTEYVNDLKKMNYFIQIDRGQFDKDTKKYRKDVVFYDTINKDFINKVLEFTGYDKGVGTSTDIKHLTEETKVASFNISCGYFNEHKTEEYIILEEMINCYNAVENVIKNLNEKYEAFV